LWTEQGADHAGDLNLTAANPAGLAVPALNRIVPIP
jgi:hypothetical protein